MVKWVLSVVVAGALLWGWHAYGTSGGTVPASLTGYNHTDKTIAAFYVNGAWGGNITPGSGGGSFVCCVDLPDPWYSGYSVTITWEDHEGKINKKQVLVPKYDAAQIGSFNVHFLRNGQIKAFGTFVMLGHPNYPLKGEEAKMPPRPSGRRGVSAIGE